MNIKSFPKSHYERASAFLSSITDIDYYLDEIHKELGDNPNFSDFADKMMKTGFLDKKEGSGNFFRHDDSNIAFLINIFFHIFMMRRNHEKIYYVTPQLAVKLAQTDLNVDTHFIRSPFREIYIQIDPGLFTVTDVQGDFPVRGFYVYLKENEDTGIKEVRIMASALLPNSDEIPFNDSLFYYKLYFSSGKIKEQVKSNIEKSLSAKRDELAKFGGLNNINHIEEFTYFVFNILLYITSKDPDIKEQLPIDFKTRIAAKKSTSKINKLTKMANRSTTYPVIIVGDSIKDEMNQVDEIKKAGGVGNWKLTKRVYVSGHWRTQWYGSLDNKENKVIFIEPYYKGPELADVIHQRYQIGANA
jgi:hypothetical protein